MFERTYRGLWWDRALTLDEGCTPVSPGYDNCWSAEMAHRFEKVYEDCKTNDNRMLIKNGKFTGKIICREDRLILPLKVKKPTVWAVWNDPFLEDVPFDFILKTFEIMGGAHHHVFIILTKRPENALAALTSLEPFLMHDGRVSLKHWHHVWFGVTAENQEQADKRIPIPLQIPAAVHFVSCEPLLGPLNIRPGLPHKPKLSLSIGTQNSKAIDWVICGCESGPRRRPTEWPWIESLRNQCQAAGVPFFLKQGELGGKVVKAPYHEYLEVPKHD